MDANGNVSESKLKEFHQLNWKGIVVLTTSDDKKYRFKLRQLVCDVAPSNDFHYNVEPLNGSDDVESGLLRNANVQLIEFLAEAPTLVAPVIATYNSVEKTLSFSKGDLVFEKWGSMVGDIIVLQFGSGGARFGYDPPRDRFTPFRDRRRIEDGPAIVGPRCEYGCRQVGKTA